MFHPAVAGWFAGRFGRPTEAQSRGWAEISSGHDTLLMAPTGSGKTLAAFLFGLDSLVRRAPLTDGIRILYVSPLKALGADVERNLQSPLREIEAHALAHGLLIPPIRTALRTGDSSPSDRARILKQPPHVLITTPESLYLLLTSERGRKVLGTAETVIVDEVHALAGNKRGAHLALSLERLDALCGRRLQRIGLSATVEPAEEVARFLVGHAANGVPNPCRLVDAGRKQPLDLGIEVPKETLGAVASRNAWGDIHERLIALINEHKTTLIFVPSRRLAERVAHDLEQKLGEGVVQAHHGALAKRTRQSVERRLQTGELKAVVATASLELGIDIGAVELVCQLGSPRAVSVLRQRVGRAAHVVGGVPKGRIFALTRDELLECAAGVRAMREGLIDRAVWREAPLDILAQQLVAICGAAPSTVGELWSLVRRAAPYASLPRSEFDAVLDMLGDGTATRRGRSGAHLHLDRINQKARGRRGARLAALTSGGAIPDKADYTVVEDPTEAVVGTLDEDFAIESMAGDIILLGSTSWRIRRVEAGRVRVENAHGQPPTIPFWNGEGLTRTEELSREVARLRTDLAGRDRQSGIALLMEECCLERGGAEQAWDYVAEGARTLGAVPTHKTVVAERFFDESGGMQLVIHAPFGARLNRAWGLALRKKFCRSFDFELQAAASDDAILLSIGPQHSFPLDSIFAFVNERNARETVLQAALQSPMWETRWRWNSTRALAVLRHTGGKRTPPPILRMRAADLLAAVFPAATGCQDNHGGVMRDDLDLPDHPLVWETNRDCLEEAMDVAGLERVLRQIAAGEIECLARDTVAPTPWSHAILNSMPYTFLDDAPLEERRARAVMTSRPGDLLPEDLTRLDPEAIRSVLEELAEQGPRDADELHDHLCTVGCVSPREDWRPWFEELHAAGRATFHSGRWAAVEKLPALSGDDGPRFMVNGFLQSSAPVTAADVAAALDLPRDRVDDALARLEADGIVLQVSGTWCDRRILQRIHRRTLFALRESVKPVPPSELIRFLFRWQHVQPGARLHGAEGVLKVIEQLEGLELQPAAWERDILPARIENYDPAWLDELCFSGEVAWARLHATTIEEDDQKRVTGAISLYLRAHASWLLDEHHPASLPERAQRLFDELQRRGAAFASDLAASLKINDVDDALWELVRAGAVAADGFSGLRALILRTPKRRTLQGRWAILPRAPRPVGPFGDGSPVDHARLYLRRYGVVMRQILERESAAPPWRDLLAVYRRLEARGEIRGGRFVSGLTGEQFALPEAVESLRALGRSRESEEVSVAATDPLNLVGILTPGPRVPAVAGHSVLFRDGAPVVALRTLNEGKPLGTGSPSLREGLAPSGQLPRLAPLGSPLA
jgi:ATP-dependent Lhr-like helicase